MSMCQEIIKGKPCDGKRKQFNLKVDYWVDEDKQTEGVLLTHQSACSKCGIETEHTTRYIEVKEE
tara:strand:- start:241 stop:435 length:195 start_codon:yes stop_codon:yes gene_type:complete